MALSANPARQRRLSVAEAADYHGCSQKTIRRAIADGRLRAYRVGPRMIRIDPRDLDRFARPIPAVSNGAA
jgi:excisionase family DNA binding protein